MLVTYVVKHLVGFIKKTLLTDFLTSIERVIDSILACRVVLHIREQGDREKQDLIRSQQATGILYFAQMSMDPDMTGTSEVD